MVCSARTEADSSYEGMCRFFRWRRAQSGNALTSVPHGHGLLDEVEAELQSGLSWMELMAAGGVAGVIAWVVSSLRRLGCGPRLASRLWHAVAVTSLETVIADHQSTGVAPPSSLLLRGLSTATRKACPGALL